MLYHRTLTALLIITSSTCIKIRSMEESTLDNKLQHLHTIVIKNCAIKKLMKIESNHLLLQEKNNDLFMFSQQQIQREHKDNGYSQKGDSIIKLPQRHFPLLCTSYNGQFSVELRTGNRNKHILVIGNNTTGDAQYVITSSAPESRWNINNEGTLISREDSSFNLVLFNTKELINIQPVPTISTLFKKAVLNIGKAALHVAKDAITKGEHYGDWFIRSFGTCSSSTFGKKKPYFIYALHDGSFEFHENIMGKEVIKNVYQNIHESAIKNITFDDSDEYILSCADQSLCITDRKIVYKTPWKENVVDLYWGKIVGFSEPVIAFLHHEKSNNSEDEKKHRQYHQVLLFFNT